MIWQGWQPIASAPRDGTRILVGGCISGPSVRILAWGNGRYISPSKGYQPDWVDGGNYGFQPTHWMPLPAAPVIA